MTIPEVRHLADKEAVSQTAAEEFHRLACAAVASRGRFSVALSGGSTPKRLYQILAAPPWRDTLDWSRIELFFGDERSVPPDDEDSNYHMAREAMIEPLGLSPTRVHRMEAERPNLEAAAQAYEATLARSFGLPAGALARPPAFDLVLLGMGPDGHTASLFPYTAALRETKRWCVPNWVPQQNTHRMTLTVPVLNRAGVVMFLVAGGDKAEPLAAVLEGPPDHERLPSQRIQPICGKLLFLVDPAASERLERY
jgi:6-phosphogluconolactonase